MWELFGILRVYRITSHCVRTLKLSRWWLRHHPRKAGMLQQLLLVIQWGTRIYLVIYLFLLVVHILHLWSASSGAETHQGLNALRYRAHWTLSADDICPGDGTWGEHGGTPRTRSLQGWLNPNWRPPVATVCCQQLWVALPSSGSLRASPDTGAVPCVLILGWG